MSYYPLKATELERALQAATNFASTAISLARMLLKEVFPNGVDAGCAGTVDGEAAFVARVGDSIKSVSYIEEAFVVTALDALRGGTLSTTYRTSDPNFNPMLLTSITYRHTRGTIAIEDVELVGAKPIVELLATWSALQV